MKRLRNYLIGVDQGSEVMFSDFADDGPMWSDEGPREARALVRFSEVYKTVPMVHVALSMWDTSSDMNQRADLRAEAIRLDGFQMVFRTWGDSRVARVRADWMAIGELRDSDEWELY